MGALLAFLAVALIAGCGSGSSSSTEAETTTTAGPSGDDVLVEYSRSGGIAASFQEVTIQADGDAVSDAGYTEADVKSEEFQLSDAELEDLTAAVEAADLDAVEHGPGGCADCYVYAITTADGTVEISEADMYEGGGGAVPNEVLELIDQLSGITQSNLATLPPPGG